MFRCVRGALYLACGDLASVGGSGLDGLTTLGGFHCRCEWPCKPGIVVFPVLDMWDSNVCRYWAIAEQCAHYLRLYLCTLFSEWMHRILCCACVFIQGVHLICFV